MPYDERKRVLYGLLYSEYKKLADAENKVIFGGRLGEYKYYDMDSKDPDTYEKTVKEFIQKHL